jgi:VWFA-related protein
MDRTALSGARRAAQGLGGPTIEVYSRETVVDVTVLDAKGQPVHGLTQADFSVEEDGKPEPMRSFHEFGAAGPMVQQAVGKLPPNVYSNRQAAETGTLNIIVIDTLHMDPMGGMRAKKEATDYLRKMPEGTRMALLTLGSELQLVQGFTTDKDVLIAALNDMKNTVMPTGWANASPCVRASVGMLATPQALRQIGAMLVGDKGKKNVLWFTGNQTSLGPTPYCGSPRHYPEDAEALEMLAAAQVTLYTIDTRGLVNPVAPLSAEFGADTPPMMRERTYYGGSPLDQVAAATGGRHFFGSNDFVGEMSQAVELGSNYYSITYVPGHGNDSNFHNIKVKVDRPGLTLMYRLGYGADDIAKIEAHSEIPATLDATTPAPEKNTMSASMARFAPPATQVLFDVKVAPTMSAPKPTDPPVMGFPAAEVKSKPMVRYDIAYKVPVDQIGLTDWPGGLHQGSMEFDVVASDVFGKLITSVSRKVQLSMTEEEYWDFVGQPYQYFQQIDLPPGQIYLRVGILDGMSKRVGTVEIPLKVVKKAGVVVAGR